MREAWLAYTWRSAAPDRVFLPHWYPEMIRKKAIAKRIWVMNFIAGSKGMCALSTWKKITRMIAKTRMQSIVELRFIDDFAVLRFCLSFQIVGDPGRGRVFGR